MSVTVYHLTSEKNINTIIKNGLIPCHSEGLTLEGSWAEDIYPSSPLYVCTDDKEKALKRLIDAGYLDHIESPVLIEISLPDDAMLYPDLPTFISDTEAYISDDNEGFWWKYGKEPFGLEEFIEENEDGVIYFDDLMDRECLMVAAIQSVGSAVVCDTIRPEHISGWEKIEALSQTSENRPKPFASHSHP